MRARYLPAFLLASIVSMDVPAQPMTFEFTAVFNGGMGGSVPPLLDFGLPPGTQFTGTFTLDDQTASSYSDPHIALYDNPLTALTLHVGPSGSLGHFTLGESVDSNDSRSSTLSILDEYSTGGAPFDQFAVNVALSPAPDDDPAWIRTLHFDAYTGEWIPGNLFSGIPTLGDVFTRADDPDFLSHLSLSYSITTGSTIDDYRSAYVTAQVTDVHAVARGVPEPGTVSLLAAGLLGVVFAHRRRRPHARS